MFLGYFHSQENFENGNKNQITVKVLFGLLKYQQELQYDIE